MSTRYHRSGLQIEFGKEYHDLEMRNTSVKLMEEEFEEIYHLSIVELIKPCNLRDEYEDDNVRARKKRLGQ